MVSFKEVSFLTNLKADIIAAPWALSPVANSFPVPSSQGKPRHAYLTARGILVWSADRQVAISWDELFKFIEGQFPEMVKPTLALPKIPAHIVQRIAPANPGEIAATAAEEKLKSLPVEAKA